MESLPPRPDQAEIKAWKQRTTSLIRRLDELCKRVGARALLVVHRPGMPQPLEGYLSPDFVKEAEGLIRNYESTLQGPTDFISVRAQERQSPTLPLLGFSPPCSSVPAVPLIPESPRFRGGVPQGSRVAKRPRTSTDRTYFVKLDMLDQV